MEKTIGEKLTGRTEYEWLCCNQREEVGQEGELPCLKLNNFELATLWQPPKFGRGTGTCTFPASSVLLDFLVQHEEGQTGLDIVAGYLMTSTKGATIDPKNATEISAIERTSQSLHTLLDKKIKHFKDLPPKLKRWIIDDSALRIVEDGKLRTGVPDRLFENHPICTKCGHRKCPDCPVSTDREAHLCPAMKLLGAVARIKNAPTASTEGAEASEEQRQVSFEVGQIEDRKKQASIKHDYIIQVKSTDGTEGNEDKEANEVASQEMNVILDLGEKGHSTMRNDIKQAYTVKTKSMDSNKDEDERKYESESDGGLYSA